MKLEDRMITILSTVLAAAVIAVIIILLIVTDSPKPEPNPKVYINVMESPFNAIPNDTLSDVVAFKDAVEVITHLSKGNPYIDFVMYVPYGKYILDGSIDFKKVKTDVVYNSFVFNIGSGKEPVTIQNCNITIK